MFSNRNGMRGAMNNSTEHDETSPGWLKRKFSPIRTYFRRRILTFIIYVNKIRPPGLGGVGMFDMSRFFLVALSDRNFTLAAAAMAFRFFFALFPGLIFLFTLIPHIPVDGLQDKILDFIANGIPMEGVNMVETIVEDVFSRSKFSLLSFNLVIMIFASVGGIKALLFAFSKEDDMVFQKRNIIFIHLVALEIFAVLNLAFFASFAIWFLGGYFSSELIEMGYAEQGWIVAFLRLGVSLGMFLVFFLTTSFIYYVGPETKERYSFFSPGGIVASTLILAAVYVFKYFISNFVNYSKFYGSLSTIMILMVWFYWVSSVLMIGFELNASIAIAKKRGRIRGGFRNRALHPAHSPEK